MIKVKVRGLEDVIKFIESVPHGMKGESAQTITDYLMGDKHHGLKWYPNYKSPTYVRTYTLRRNWHKTGDKWRPVIRNNTPYAKWVVGDNTQSRIMKRIGWKTVTENIAMNIDKAIKRADQAIKDWLKKKGA